MDCVGSVEVCFEEPVVVSDSAGGDLAYKLLAVMAAAVLCLGRRSDFVCRKVSDKEGNHNCPRAGRNYYYFFLLKFFLAPASTKPEG